MEDILSRTGFGLYSFMLLSFGSLCYLTDAVAYMNLPLYLPMISCDVHLSKSAVAAVDFSVYIGMAVGGFLLCAVSDVVGRKTIIAASLLLIFLSILIAAFAYGSYGFILAMLLFGTGLEANMNVVKVLLYETIIKKYRYACLMCLDLFWTIGMSTALGFYGITMPIILRYYNEYQRFLNWRISVLLSVFLAIILACITALLLESPKYLLFERRPRDALEVLREIYTINKSKLFTTFQIADGDLHGKILDFGISLERDIPNTLSTHRLRIIFRRIHKSLLVLVRKQFIHRTLVAIILRWIMSMSSLPMFMFWSKCMNLQNNELIIDNFYPWHFEHPVLRNCNNYGKELSYELYKNFAILTAISTCGGALVIILIRYMKRSSIMTSALFLTGVFSTLLGLVLNNYTMRIVFSGMLVVTYTVAGSCLDLTILDMFPTAIRSTAMGETMIFARLASVFVIKYMAGSIQWLFIGFGCIMEFGAVLALFLPKLTDDLIVD